MREYFKPPMKDELKRIYDDVGATEESLKNDVNNLMEWMEKQPHLPNIKDEAWLKHFLLCCKNSLERTKQRLDNYYTSRATSSDIFSGRKELIPFAKPLCDIMAFVPLPKLTKEGHRVLIFRIFGEGNFPITSELLIKTGQVVYDMLLKTDFCSQYIIIFDMENMTLPLKINPFRFRKFYAVNVVPAVEPLVNFSINLLSKKLAARTEIWKKKTRDFVEIFPEEILPPRYGGTEKSEKILRDEWIDYFFQFTDWVLEEEFIKADLSKKPSENEASTAVPDYGINGTFRKINLD